MHPVTSQHQLQYIQQHDSPTQEAHLQTFLDSSEEFYSFYPINSKNSFVSSDHGPVFHEPKIIIGEMRYYFDGGERKRRDKLDLRLRRKIVARTAVTDAERRYGGRMEIRSNRGCSREMTSVLFWG